MFPRALGSLLLTIVAYASGPGLVGGLSMETARSLLVASRFPFLGSLVGGRGAPWVRSPRPIPRRLR